MDSASNGRPEGGRKATAAVEEYPGRPPFFAWDFLRFVQSMTRVDKLGPPEQALLMAVAILEHDTGYVRPVRFTNEQLANQMHACEKTMRTARSGLMKAGWIQYTPGRRGHPGTYWIDIPPDLRKSFPGKIYHESGTYRAPNVPLSYQETDSTPFSLDPDPILKKEKSARKRFVPPTLKEVTAYCQERGNQVDPQEWLDHYEANGWMRGKNKIVNWRAAVRTWEGQQRRNGSAKKKRGFPKI